MKYKNTSAVFSKIILLSLLNSNEGEEEELYANMNFTGKGNAGQRWEDYQKTATLLKGVEPPKKR